MIKTTATSPTTAIMEFRIVVRRVWKLLEEVSGQPAAFLTASLAPLLQMLVVVLSAKTEVAVPRPNTPAIRGKVNKMALDDFMNLLC